jgi:hypothetical protein
MGMSSTCNKSIAVEVVQLGMEVPTVVVQDASKPETTGRGILGKLI